MGLRRETLREDVEEDVLDFLFSAFRREALEVFSEHTELLSV